MKRFAVEIVIAAALRRGLIVYRQQSIFRLPVFAGQHLAIAHECTEAVGPGPILDVIRFVHHAEFVARLWIAEKIQIPLKDIAVADNQLRRLAQRQHGFVERRLQPAAERADLFHQLQADVAGDELSQRVPLHLDRPFRFGQILPALPDAGGIGIQLIGFVDVDFTHIVHRRKGLDKRTYLLRGQSLSLENFFQRIAPTHQCLVSQPARFNRQLRHHDRRRLFCCAATGPIRQACNQQGPQPEARPSLFSGRAGMF